MIDLLIQKKSIRIFFFPSSEVFGFSQKDGGRKDAGTQPSFILCRGDCRHGFVPGFAGFPGGRGCCVPWAHRAGHGAGGRAGTPTLPSSVWGWIWGLPLLPHPFPKTCPFRRALFGCRDADGVGGLELGSSGMDLERESEGSPGGWRRLFFQLKS